MPILYNVRHGLELALKYVLRELAAINMAVERDGAVDHDVKSYWEHLSAQVVGDHRCRTLIAALEPFVQSLGKIDPDGQALRYFQNRDGRQSLADYAVVHLPLIQASIAGLREILDQLVRRVSELEQEVAAGAMTNECSRSDLIQIAGVVGAKATWTEAAFLDRKAEARARFGLTSNGISRALAVIQDARELKTLIGIETPLAYLSAGTLTEIAVRWLETNPPPAANVESTVVSATDIDFEEMDRHCKAAAVLDRWALERLSIEEFADLQTIFYVGRDRLFGELYERVLEGTLATHRVETRRIMLVHHILSKTNFIDGLIAGLIRVGQPTLATQIKQLQDEARPHL
ncbi:MAG: hypothetical protein ABS86_01915 [Sphingobium sp. SCN 64-10]|nr:MAG: hypothetical protein ABS86_01915 [Sphingobium sp. SCN 64-10]